MSEFIDADAQTVAERLRDPRPLPAGFHFRLTRSGIIVQIILRERLERDFARVGVRGPRIYDAETGEELSRHRVWVARSDIFAQANYLRWLLPYRRGPRHSLTVRSEPVQPEFTLDLTDAISGLLFRRRVKPTYTGRVIQGSYTAIAPEAPVVGRETYAFISWEDDTADLARTFLLNRDLIIVATYEKVVIERFFKSHVIVSLAYSEQKIFEVHEMMPHATPDLPVAAACSLAIDIMLEYGGGEGGTHMEIMVFDENTVFNVGLVETKETAKLNETTPALIFDLRYNKVRRTYQIKWVRQVTLEREVKISYTDIALLDTISREAHKDTFRDEEAIGETTEEEMDEECQK